MATQEYYAQNKEHVKLQVAQWQAKNLEKVRGYKKKYDDKSKEKKKQWQLNYRKVNPLKYLFNLAKKRAFRKGLEFNIELSDLSLPEVCPYLNIKLDHFSENFDVHFSIDRIDNSKGYIKGNVEVISQRANRLKNNATGEELLVIALRMLGRQE